MTDSAAFYIGEAAVTVDGQTYNKGDRITARLYVHNGSSYALTNIDTEEKASNAFADSSGNTLLSIVWKPYSYVQTNTVNALTVYILH